jgi:F-type H+-transporting ATPase subunit epsilon
MEDNFKLEIIGPEKILFSDNVKATKIPSYEGDMSILKNHISTITFLRPGIVKVDKNDGKSEDFFVEDGTVEFFNNTLVLLSASAVNVKNISIDFIENLSKETKETLIKNNITDQERYILNHKLDVIKEIGI